MREKQTPSSNTRQRRLLEEEERDAAVPRQADIDKAIDSIRSLRKWTEKITVDALLSARHEGHAY